MLAIFQRYPMLQPYLGAGYAPGNPRSLLLIGESHYLDRESTQHLSAETWYASDATTLNGDEKTWINTAQIIAGSRAEGFRNKAHSVCRNSLKEINQGGPNYCVFDRVADEVAFYNYFLRPARTGVSLQVVEEDERVAQEVFAQLLGELRPGAIVFLSRLAHRSWRSRFAQPFSVPVIATPHPGCRHWNRACAAYGGRRGRDVLREFVSDIWHPTQPAVGP